VLIVWQVRESLFKTRIKFEQSNFFFPNLYKFYNLYIFMDFYFEKFPIVLYYKSEKDYL
jgi:hypothetical protein